MTPIEVLAETVLKLATNIGNIQGLEKTIEKIELIATKMEMQQSKSLHYRISDLMLLLQCSRSSIDKLIEAGLIGYYTIGSEYRFTQTHVDEYVSKMEVKSRKK